MRGSLAAPGPKPPSAARRLQPVRHAAPGTPEQQPACACRRCMEWLLRLLPSAHLLHPAARRAGYPPAWQPLPSAEVLRHAARCTRPPAARLPLLQLPPALDSWSRLLGRSLCPCHYCCLAAHAPPGPLPDSTAAPARMSLPVPPVQRGAAQHQPLLAELPAAGPACSICLPAAPHKEPPMEPRPQPPSAVGRVTGSMLHSVLQGPCSARPDCHTSKIHSASSPPCLHISQISVTHQPVRLSQRMQCFICQPSRFKQQAQLQQAAQVGPRQPPPADRSTAAAAAATAAATVHRMEQHCQEAVSLRGMEQGRDHIASRRVCLSCRAMQRGPL